MQQIFIGLITEGTTDIRFLKPILEKTLESVAFDCRGQIDIIVEEIRISKKELSFVEYGLKSSRQGVTTFGMAALCVQADADKKTLDDTYNNKILHLKKALEDKSDAEYCKILIPLIPIQETEAWLLADKALLKEQIGTTLSDTVLGIDRIVEGIANPKEVIQNAIRIARQELSKRKRRDLTISDLYIIGSKIDITKLEQLSSYNDFAKNIREAFTALNLL